MNGCEVPVKDLEASCLGKLFATAFTRFVGAEARNILDGTSERNLCARLAPIIEAEAQAVGIRGYYADVEYNRKQRGQVKTILDDQMRIVPITCDLLLHSRGEIIARDNLIAVEMKRVEHPAAEKLKDRLRVRALTKATYDEIWSYDGETLPEHVCGYVVGYFVEVDLRKRQFLIEEYQKGKFVSQRFQGL